VGKWLVDTFEDIPSSLIFNQPFQMKAFTTPQNLKQLSMEWPIAPAW